MNISRNMPRYSVIKQWYTCQVLISVKKNINEVIFKNWSYLPLFRIITTTNSISFYFLLIYNSIDMGITSMIIAISTLQHVDLLFSIAYQFNINGRRVVSVKKSVYSSFWSINMLLR